MSHGTNMDWNFLSWEFVKLKTYSNLFFILIRGPDQNQIYKVIHLEKQLLLNKYSILNALWKRFYFLIICILEYVIFNDQ